MLLDHCLTQEQPRLGFFLAVTVGNIFYQETIIFFVAPTVCISFDSTLEVLKFGHLLVYYSFLQTLSLLKHVVVTWTISEYARTRDKL